MMLKILVVITTGIASYGGLTTVAMNYYRQIDKCKFHMDFASYNDIQNELKIEMIENGSVYFKLPFRYKQPIQYLCALRKLAKEYDIVHVHANSATSTLDLMAVALAGVKKRIIHNHNSTCLHMTFHRLLKPLFDKLYTTPIACSNAAGNWIFGSNNFIVLSNAIDLKKYEFNEQFRKEIRSKYSIDDDVMVVGHVGKFTKQKNHNFLIKIFAELKRQGISTVLMLVGDGVLRSNTEAEAEKLGISNQVIFCGMQNSALKYFSAFDCLVFPSLWEGLPLSVLEAQANGLECILSDQITAEVDMGGVNFLSLDDTLSKWVNAISKTMSRKYNPDRYWPEMKKKGFDIKENVRSLEAIYLDELHKSK